MNKISATEQLLPGKHICVVSTAVVPKGSSLQVIHEHLILVAVVERETGCIVALDINTACDLTKEFLRAIFIGKNLLNDVEEIKNELQENYLGLSRKAIIVATVNARQRLLEHLK